MPDELIYKNDVITKNVDPNSWRDVNGFKCHILIEQDEDAGFSAIVLNLPGVGSCGDTEEEAVTNVREAIEGAIEEYQASGQPIPWKDRSTRDALLARRASEGVFNPSLARRANNKGSGDRSTPKQEKQPWQ